MEQIELLEIQAGLYTGKAIAEEQHEAAKEFISDDYDGFTPQTEKDLECILDAIKIVERELEKFK
jgi:hypothetical protein